MACLRSPSQKLSESGYRTDMLESTARAFGDQMVNGFDFSANTEQRHTIVKVVLLESVLAAGWWL